MTKNSADKKSSKQEEGTVLSHEPNSERQSVESTHTPLPWSLDVDELETEDDGTVIAGMITIRQIERCLHDTEWAESSDWERDLANAQLIVEAVNAYADLKDQRDMLAQTLETRAEREMEMLAEVAAENDALKAENERLKQHVRDLDHDFQSSLTYCDKHHVVGQEAS